MLRNSLYTIVDREVEDGKSVRARYSLRLNGGGTILRAHFPGRPIVPGACLVQMAVELAQDAVRAPLTLCGLRGVKFLRPVTPSAAPVVQCHIEGTGRGVEMCHDVTVMCGDTIYAKMSLICKTI